MNIIAQTLIGIFLTLNLIARIHVLDNHGVVLKLLLPTLVVIPLIVYLHKGFIRLCFFILGLTLPLYGYQSYTLNNHIFEFILFFLGLILLFSGENVRNLKYSENILAVYIGSFLLLLSCSLLLFPLESFFATFRLWGFFSFCNAFIGATPGDPMYSLAALNRLALFVILLYAINTKATADKIYTSLFIGCGCSVICACVLGILNQFGWLSLTWLRPDVITKSGFHRLHSVFGNPGWFAEYILICTPLVLLLTRKLPGIFVKVLLLLPVLAIIVMCLFFTGSRTSWLIIPVVVMLCFFGLLRFNNNEKREMSTQAKSALKSTTWSVILACCVIAAVFFGMSKTSYFDSRNVNFASSQQYLNKRIKDIFNPTERVKLWQESLVLISESPLYGLGYEGYRWHQEVMTSIPSSKFSHERQTKNNWDTAHNFYIQLAVGNGIVGLSIWLLLITYALWRLYSNAFKNNDIRLFALFSSLVVFHLYGLTQSMQYVAAVYFMVFAVLGYTLRLNSATADSPTDGSVFVKLGRYAGLVSFFAALVGCLVYIDNYQSRKLSERYGIIRYTADRDGHFYRGFYKKEDWGKDGIYRWSGKEAEIDLFYAGVVKITFACFAPNLNISPSTVEVKLDGKLVDNYTFNRAEKITRTYSIPKKMDNLPAVLSIRVSRVWNPKKEKLNSDLRNLGIAVSEPHYLRFIPFGLPLLLK